MNRKIALEFLNSLDKKSGYSNTLLELFMHIKTLTNNAYLVGGCVRDIVLNKEPKDFDIVTDCDLEQLKKMLRDNNWSITDAGENFLVTIASKHGEQYEIALYRKDGTYSDGRRPDFVEIGDINSDAERRDLTINALYMCPYTKEILDPTKKGLSDIQNRLIRMNGRADDRIKEDKLRIMRVYRFSNQLGFKIEKRTLKACRKYFNDMYSQVSPERVKNEIEKMCTFE
jgi:tRNA nucleotidyltransferase/poly(A) polymerase